MDSPLTMFVLLTVVPFVTGACLLLVGLRFRRTRMRVASLAVGVCSLIGSVFFFLFAGSYLWALHLESKWLPAEPKTKVELESYLSLYSESEICFDTPGWGIDHPVEPGERMVRYSILLGAPLDVVYTNDDRLVAIYTTYE